MPLQPVAHPFNPSPGREGFAVAVSDMTIEITDTANDDWNRCGIQRYRFEQNTRDPEDVRRELERVKKRLDERAAKEKQAKHPAASKS